MLTLHRKRSQALFGIGCAFVAALLAWPSLITKARTRAAALVEQGTFRLHKFEQPIGEEKYSLQQDGDELQLSVNFHFNDRGQDVPLATYLRMGRDFVTRSMEIHGEIARGTPLDETVLVEQRK